MLSSTGLKLSTAIKTFIFTVLAVISCNSFGAYVTYESSNRSWVPGHWEHHRWIPGHYVRYYENYRHRGYYNKYYRHHDYDYGYSGHGNRVWVPAHWNRWGQYVSGHWQ